MADAIPDYVESVTIMVDADAAGESNSIELARRVVARGVEVLMVRGGDA
jgi:NAD-dependent oxidoreductase involved in siderophore biosynthesis